MLTASLILSTLTIVSFLFLKYSKSYYESISSLDQDMDLKDIVFMHTFFIIPIANLIVAAVTLGILAVGILVISINATTKFLLKSVKANHEH